jgi:GxxExxY protein
VIAAAIAVHREIGPGLDETVYSQALSMELAAMNIEHECQVALPLIYKETRLDCGYRIDVLVKRQLLIELKAVEKLHPIHEAQLITYLRLSKIRLGLLLNFGQLVLRDGIRRRANSQTRVPPQPIPKTPGADKFDSLAAEVIAAGLEVSRVLGSGLLRSAYEAALAHELSLRGIKCERKQPINLVYRNQRILSLKELPLVAEGHLMVSCVSSKSIELVTLACQRSLLKASGIEHGLCFNFHSESLETEIRRISRSTPLT